MRVEVAYRTKFKDQISKFCDDNGLIITYRQTVDHGIYGDIYNIMGEYSDIENLHRYVKKLESIRKDNLYKLLL